MISNHVGIPDNGVIKSISDKKNYKVIVLGNGLKVLLISDLYDKSKGKNIDAKRKISESASEESELSEDSASEEISDSSEGESGEENENHTVEASNKQAAAALCIAVGSFHDPASVPGLAHFLEHMVFMGSAKYPDENKFDAFIKRHGGSDNASTDTESTVFQFEIQPEYFEAALDIWAQFFISPLLKKDSVKREMKAVDSEFSLAINSDVCKKEQLLSSLIKKDHAMGKFMWGNYHSLTKIPEDHGVDVYTALEQFYNKCYISERMTLTVQTPDTLENLETMVRNIFENVLSSRDRQPHQQNSTDTYIQACYFENHTPYSVIKLDPVRDIHELQLTWIMSPQQDHYKTKPIHYASWLVGHEGKGSILSYLRKMKFATALSGGNTETGYENNKTCSLFNINVTLTENGFENFNEVLDVIHKYLEYLRKIGPQERIFNEIRKIEDISFMFQEDKTPLEYVEDQCENMRLYPTEDILTGDELLMEYKPEVITGVLNQLTPDKCAVFLSSPKHKELIATSETLLEPWFNTKYLIVRSSREWVLKWKHIASSKKIPELHIPPPNKLIAEKFDLKCETVEKGLKKSGTIEKFPILLSENEDNYKLWFKQDTHFKLPKAYINVSLGNPISLASPKNKVCLDIFLSILSLNMAEVVYDANAASLDYSLKIVSGGCMEMTFSGFDDNLAELAFIVCKFISEFKTTEDVFKLYLEQEKRLIKNLIIKPAKLGNDLRLSLIEHNRWSLFDKLKAVDNITFEEFVTFSREFVSNLSSEMLIQGNYTTTEATSIAKNVSKILNLKHFKSDYMFNDRVINIHNHQHFCKIRGCNPTDENSMLTVYYQIGECDIRDTTLMDLMISFMEEPCFDILRTKQQLGYVVYAQQHNTAGILGFSIQVQSQRSKHSVENVDQAIMKFVNEEMPSIMENLQQKEFATQVAAVISNKTNEDSHLGEEVDRNWSEIATQNYHFDRLDREVYHLRTLTLDTIKKYYKDVTQVNQKVLHVQVEGRIQTPASKESPKQDIRLEYLSNVDIGSDGEKPENYIMDINKFKDSATLYPVSHIKYV